MALQNRVTPFGEVIATAARGTLMGNRGCLHDAERRIRRNFVGKRWIICVLQFKGRRRTVMTPDRYTELFFLDEATALAAGHRPCAECQRERFLLFREHWAGRRSTPLPVEALDGVLHAERLDARRGKRRYTERLSRLPAGAMITNGDGRSWLVHGESLREWTPDGYGRATRRSGDREVAVLTPRSIVGALARGYPVEVHASARA